jgi:hypothetical protein
MNSEIWKDIEGYEGLYQVSNQVRVKSLQRLITVHRKYGITTRIIPEKILIPGRGNGYNTVSLWKENKGRTHKLSVLAATAFIPNPDNLPLVNHLDGVKTNDWLSNYEWATYSRNTLHAVEHNLMNTAKGEDAANAKLTENDVRDIRQITGKSNREIARNYGVTHSAINSLKQRKTWKHII